MADALVFGSGFCGTLTAQIAKRYGYDVRLIDRRPHPRFAIGESTTPLGSNLLASICEEHNVPELRFLCEYGTATPGASRQETVGDDFEGRPRLPRSLSPCEREETPGDPPAASNASLATASGGTPGVDRPPTVGLKRGFTYVRHDPRREPAVNDGDLLMFAASSADAVSDTHWLRADVDAHAVAVAGVPLEIGDVRPPNGVPVIDATGGGKLFDLPAVPDNVFRTRSSAVYTHVRGLRRLTDCCDVRGGVPFDPDAAAVHHLLEEGWMWQLRFDDGRVSVGLCFEGWGDRSEADARQVIARYPMLRRQFADAEVCESPGRWITAPRLQRRLADAGGRAMLPSSFGFVDPMHSTGLALNLAQVARWAAAIRDAAGGPFPRLPVGPLAEEQRFVDAVVSLAYRTRRDMTAFEAAASLHVAAAMSCENTPDPQRAQLVTPPVVRAAEEMHAALDGGGGAELTAIATAAVRECGVECLFDPAVNRRYAATAAR